ncbi:MAG: glucose-6-phosphate isomerase [Actinomycetota bacterium]|nr:glucose-6-phosphate isomerase [Actinomycetota bacterium]
MAAAAPPVSHAPVGEMIARARLGALQASVDAVVGDLVARRAPARLWSRDHTLWQDDPTDVADRLGWLTVVTEMQGQIPRLEALAAEAVADGLRHAVLLGMGGSSLFPEVLWRTFGAAPGSLDLRVLDTTDPAAVARVARDFDLASCLFVAASKSGTTIETSSQLAHFWELTGGDGRRFVAITDPGTELAELGRDRGFRAVFESRPDIGGRYSALSYFGLVPAALLGVDVAGLLAKAAAAAAATGPEVDGATNPALHLAAIIAAGARQGRDKLTLELPREIGTFGLWLEQLVAESTGKAGTGIVPVAGEVLGRVGEYGDDRLFVSTGYRPGLDDLVEAGHPVVELGYRRPLDLGGLVLLWEQAVALSGAVLGINPFDQPDVAAAKEATDRVLAAGLPADIEVVPLGELIDQVGPGDYLAIQAYVDPGDPVLIAGLQAARMKLRHRLRVATTLGIGPRFLHSTGQLHKGGPPTGVFVQVVGDDPVDVAIPGKPFGFSTLKRAQAAGDLLALRSRGLRAGRVALDELLAVTA